ncbi:MAG TPA: glycoside hydrolase family 99-like domain-containing protein [Acidimicrobiales bacterium]|nr:glycoside hydrolase family 99-like domain-containing protein [Acidimicrobiales bacterium]
MRWLLGVVGVAGALVCAACGSASSSVTRWSPHDGKKLLVGSYYYQWFPQNLQEGTLRAHLIPPQGPDPATDVSADPATAARAITQANQAGVNFFALDWWPQTPNWAGRPLAERQTDDANTAAFLQAPNISTIKFCMLYETYALDFNAGNESTPVTPAMEKRFDADMLHFAATYFNNPSYLRVHGRPVVVLYLTRTLTGDVTQMMAGARSLLAAHGYNPYFIGDEIYWRVTDQNLPGTGSPLTTQPQATRIEAFDAITSYTLYYGDNLPSLGPTKDFIGYPGKTTIAADEVSLMNKYSAATGGKVPVIPDVTPGFNDRGVRLSINHPAQPREWLPGDGPASTLDNLFRKVAVPTVDAQAPMIFVTAWNEWNEDSGVEPVPGVATSTDDSPTGKEYTQGYTYGGEGDSALKVLRKDIDCAKDLAACKTDPPGTG